MMMSNTTCREKVRINSGIRLLLTFMLGWELYSLRPVHTWTELKLVCKPNWSIHYNSHSMRILAENLGYIDHMYMLLGIAHVTKFLASSCDHVLGKLMWSSSYLTSSCDQALGKLKHKCWTSGDAIHMHMHTCLETHASLPTHNAISLPTWQTTCWYSNVPIGSAWSVLFNPVCITSLWTDPRLKAGDLLQASGLGSYNYCRPFVYHIHLGFVFITGYLMTSLSWRNIPVSDIAFKMPLLNAESSSGDSLWWKLGSLLTFNVFETTLAYFFVKNL